LLSGMASRLTPLTVISGTGGSLTGTPLPSVSTPQVLANPVSLQTAPIPLGSVEGNDLSGTATVPTTDNITEPSQSGLGVQPVTLVIKDAQDDAPNFGLVNVPSDAVAFSLENTQLAVTTVKESTRGNHGNDHENGSQNLTGEAPSAKREARKEA